jgi:predicted nucleic acid-binding protein
MDPTLLGVVLDSSVLIAAERRRLTPAQAIQSVQQNVGEVPIVLCALTVAEIGHGIYRATTEEMRSQRRAFLDELKATVPVPSVTGATAEIIARIGGEQAAKGINLPLADLIIGATAVELGYAVATSNLRDFCRIAGLHVVQL